MGSFSSIDTFREGQWRVFRRFILTERRDVGSREAVILAEQKRIGKIRLLYGQDLTTGEVTQERIGVVIEGTPSCALSKLLQVYITLGGNPLDISMFLYPNDEECPGNGFAYIQGMAYTLSGNGSEIDSNIEKYRPSRVGGTRETQSEIVAVNMNLMRRWTLKEMYHKRIRIEERILKLCDLYEQLSEEREMMVQAVRGEGMKANYTTDRFQESHTVPALVFLLDSTWRVAEANGDVPLSAAPNEILGSFPMLMNDGPGEGNNAL